MKYEPDDNRARGTEFNLATIRMGKGTEHRPRTFPTSPGNSETQEGSFGDRRVDKWS